MQGQLSDAEVRVVALVAEGLSNREIGQRLATREAAISHQVSQIIHKLGLRNRIQLAVWAVKQGLY